MKELKTMKADLIKKLYRKIANIDNGISSLANFLVTSEVTEYNVPKLIEMRIEINKIFKDIVESETAIDSIKRVHKE